MNRGVWISKYILLHFNMILIIYENDKLHNLEDYDRIVYEVTYLGIKVNQHIENPHDDCSN